MLEVLNTVIALLLGLAGKIRAPFLINNRLQARVFPRLELHVFASTGPSTADWFM